MKAYVTGATGCVGRNLIDRLLEQRWEVAVFHRKSSDLSKLAGANVTLVEVDLFDEADIIEKLPEGVDAVFHCAGNTNHWHLQEDVQYLDNVLATRYLIEACLVRKVKRFIFTSTGATELHQWTDSKWAAKIKGGYVRTKRQAELEVYNAIPRGLDAVIVKPPSVIGKHDYSNYIELFRTMQSRVKLVLPGKATFGTAKNVAQAHINAFWRGRTGESYVLDGEYTSWLELSHRICKLMGVANPPKRTIPPAIVRALAKGMDWFSYLTRKKPLLTTNVVNLLLVTAPTTYYNKTKAAEDINYPGPNAQTLDEALAEFYEWMVEHGYDKPVYKFLLT